MKQVAEAYYQKLKMIRDEFLETLEEKEQTDELDYCIHYLKYIESPLHDEIMSVYMKKDMKLKNLLKG